ncbi:ketopantoate reductase family protein [Saccharibacillus endophyticus]|uniref:2-dehydropantoate 2-reductase n=1 Tax=Saccharibacillus endophyticus TaxID=2060666 RepID=A0ABQ1ZNV5_9BACL|nr:ketopantoate reductase family protein [Saccharibacillus endophyticus]GGH70509.1 2-dehydropantoate 2-reductase [Saccharibacillus endophyticus]
MRILIYGAGVLGSVLGQLLMQKQHEVAFLARGKRADQLEQKGLVIRHHFQRKTTTDHPRVIRTLEPNDRYDLIFIVMKYSDIEAVLPVLAANISEHIMMVGNNPNIAATEKQLKALANSDKHLAFGFQVGGGIRREDGTVVSLRFGKGQLIAGGLHGEPAFLPLLQEAFANSNAKLTLHSDIDGWLKNHIIPIVPLNAALYVHNGDLKAVARDKRLLKQIVAAMGEGFDRLETAGYPMVPAGQAKAIRRCKNILPALLSIYHRLPAATLIDGSFAEIEALDKEFRNLTVSSEKQTPNWNRLLKSKIIT